MKYRIEPGSPLTFQEGEMLSPELVDFLAGRAAVFTTRCPGKATPNEDAAAVIAFDDTQGVLAVADGMGGHASGEIAARTAIEVLASSIEEARQQGQLLRTGIINGFERANATIQDMKVGAATTLAVVEVDGPTARPYHAGDSIVLIIGDRGRVKFLTTSHSPVGFAVEAGVLDAHEAMRHEQRHLVSNAVGLPTMKIDVGPPIRLAQRDLVLLASDGLTDNLTIEEVIERIRRRTVELAIRRLADDVQERMQTSGDHPSKPDDLTLLAYRRRRQGNRRRGTAKAE